MNNIARQRWYIKRIQLNNGGYDRSGFYWGTGPALWRVYSADDTLEFTIRGTRATAKCAYQWVRNSSDPARAARHIDATGKTGGW